MSCISGFTSEKKSSNLQTSNRKSYRVFILDKLCVVVTGLMHHFNSLSGYEVCGYSCDTEKGLYEINIQKPDILIIDYNLENVFSLETISKIKENNKNLKILIYSSYKQLFLIERAFLAGADGYVIKSDCLDYLNDALANIFKQKYFINDSYDERELLENVNINGMFVKTPLNNLSDREFEVFAKIAEGFSISEISSLFNISVKTVNNHRDNIKNKLNLYNSRELLRYAMSWYNNFYKENGNITMKNVALVKNSYKQEMQPVRISSKNKPKISEGLKNKWTDHLNVISGFVNNSAVLINQALESELTTLIMVRSGMDNCGISGNMKYGTGLYCESVLSEKNVLIIEDGLKDNIWKDSIEVKKGIISYYGFPLYWPDGELFGTICLVSCEKISYEDNLKNLIKSIYNLISNDLKCLLYVCNNCASHFNLYDLYN